MASLYDRFTHALDPFSPERDTAERVFMEEVARWYGFAAATQTLAARVQEGCDSAVQTPSCRHGSAIFALKFNPAEPWAEARG